jgi:hypothetical protein
MPWKDVVAFVLAACLCCAAPVSVAQEVGDSPECAVCTARHKGLQALQRARTAKACAEDERADCAPAPEQRGTAATSSEDDATLRLPDGRKIGERD